MAQSNGQPGTMDKTRQELESFPHFPMLPKEIRDRIWNLASNQLPDGAHVHYFIIVDHRHGRISQALEAVEGDFLLLSDEGTNADTGFRLAVPDETPGLPTNDSIYTLTGGLWSASRDSQAAMERRHPKNEWWSVFLTTPNGGHPGEFTGDADAFHSATYISPNGKARQITVQPTTDLIFLMPAEDHSVDWMQFFHGDSVPLFDYATGGDGPEPSFLGRNIAIEYHPGWLAALQMPDGHHRRFHHEPGVFTLDSMEDMVDVLRAATETTIWLVDHRLRRRADADDNGESSSMAQRQSFRSASLVYTEVRKEDMNRRWTMNDASKAAAFELVNHFHEPAGSSPVDYTDRIKVLACETLAGRPVFINREREEESYFSLSPLGRTQMWYAMQLWGWQDPTLEDLNFMARDLVW